MWSYESLFFFVSIVSPWYIFLPMISAFVVNDAILCAVSKNEVSSVLILRGRLVCIASAKTVMLLRRS
jgi:hypothetical protein